MAIQTKQILGLLLALLYSFPANCGEIRLDFQRSRKFNALLVVASVNGSPAVLVVDTGSDRTILSPDIGIAATEWTGSKVFYPEARRDRMSAWGTATLSLSTRTWKNQRVVIQGQADLRRAFEQKIDGVLGQDILGQFRRITIDSVAHIIVLEY
jgi:hypothetical protein